VSVTAIKNRNKNGSAGVMKRGGTRNAIHVASIPSTTENISNCRRKVRYPEVLSRCIK